MAPPKMDVEAAGWLVDGWVADAAFVKVVVGLTSKSKSQLARSLEKSKKRVAY